MEIKTTREILSDMPPRTLRSYEDMLKIKWVRVDDVKKEIEKLYHRDIANNLIKGIFRGE